MALKCKTCKCTFENTDEVTLKYAWENCFRDNCGLNSAKGMRLKKDEKDKFSIVRYLDKSAAWLYNSQTNEISIFWEEAIEQSFKGKKVESFPAAPSLP